MSVQHMHYFTIEQRETLERQLAARAAELRAGFAADPETEDETAERERERRELAYVESSLQRLHEPEFGLCADCGEEIPYSRLQANPIAVRCLACQRVHEGAAER
ncbi:MAG: TraR/DksA family transcriptional regulator [Gammaproteobacteria bacterium]|nr:TraR/DksA family transcriptional regulator [Gammaproteobacteria bacterium]